MQTNSKNNRPSMDQMFLEHITATPGSMLPNYCHLHFTGEDAETQWVKSFAQVTQCVGGTNNPSSSAFHIHAFNRHECCLSPPRTVSKSQGIHLAAVGRVGLTTGGCCFVVAAAEVLRAVRVVGRSPSWP